MTRYALWSTAGLLGLATVAGLVGTTDTPVAAEQARSDLAVELTTTPFGAKPGERVTHKLTLRNDGPSAAATAVVRFASTAALEGVDIDPAAGVCRPDGTREYVCTFGRFDVTSGEPEVISIAGKIAAGAPAGGLVKNVATVSAATLDVESADNTSVNGYLLYAETAATAAAVPPADRPGAAAPVAAKAEPAPARVALHEDAAAESFVAHALNRPWYFPFLIAVVLVALIIGLRKLLGHAGRQLGGVRRGLDRLGGAGLGAVRRGRGIHRAPGAWPGEPAATPARVTATASVAAAASAAAQDGPSGYPQPAAIRPPSSHEQPWCSEAPSAPWMSAEPLGRPVPNSAAPVEPGERRSAEARWAPRSSTPSWHDVRSTEEPQDSAYSAPRHAAPIYVGRRAAPESPPSEPLYAALRDCLRRHATWHDERPVNPSRPAGRHAEEW